MILSSKYQKNSIVFLMIVQFQNNLVEEVCFMIDGKFQYISRSDKVKRLYSVLEKMEELCFEVR